MQFHATAWVENKSSRTDIGEDRFVALRAARDDVLFAIKLEEKLSLLIANYAEFERELLALAHEATVWAKHDHETSMTHRLLLDRRLVNLLTACRLYLDQTDHGISGLFGNPSAKLAGVKKFKNELWDKHWGYRLLEAVRNHVQHAGLPIHKISYNHAAVDAPGSGQVETSVVPTSLVLFFAEDPKFHPKVLAELKTRGDEVDLRFPIREYVTCFVKLHDELRRVIASRVDQSRALLVAAIAEYAAVGEKRVSFVYVESSQDETGVVLERVYVGSDFLERLDALVDRNRVNQDLTRYSVTNREKCSSVQQRM